MVFSNTTSKAGILQMIEKITGLGDAVITGTPAELAYFTELVNNWLHQINQWIKEVQGEWQYDDANLSGFPIEEFDFVDDQQDYGLTTDGERDSLMISKVEIRDTTTEDYSTIEFCLQKDIEENAFALDSGIPTKYWLSGGSIVFNCPIDTALVDKYRISYDRTAHIFTTADTTSEPGFDKQFHPILYYGPSMDWALIKGNANVAQLCNKKIYGSADPREAGLKELLQDFYSTRAKEFKPRIMRKSINWS